MNISSTRRLYHTNLPAAMVDASKNDVSARCLAHKPTHDDITSSKAIVHGLCKSDTHDDDTVDDSANLASFLVGRVGCQRSHE